MFIKQNNYGNDSLLQEAKGLELLKSMSEVTGLKIPEIYLASNVELQVKRVDCHPPSKEQMARLGEGLATLHTTATEKQFGLNEDNYIGHSEQLNGWSGNWGDFFLQKRLLAQIGWIKKQGIKEELVSFFKKKQEEVIQILNLHNPTPSLLHGDLWSGNILFTQTDIYLIDPAVYYGDGEADLSIAGIFGGFHQAFYEEYYRLRPKAEGFEKRASLYKLYHALNHYNLFGESYLSMVRSLLYSFDS